MLNIVGVGICKGHITERAKMLIKSADIVYGSKRAVELVKDLIECKTIILKKFDKNEFAEIIKASKKYNVVVLSTGDPMISGLGTKLKGFVEPGISSVQVALAKLGIDLCEVVVVDAHAKKEVELDFLDKRHLLILADKKFDPSVLGHRKITVIENICMSHESIYSCFADEVKLKSDYSIIFVEKRGR